MSELEPSYGPISPTMLGKYRLLDTLGAGAMGTVYRAEFQGIDGYRRIVALKVVEPDLARQPGFARCFVDEARLGGYLNHPNIVSTFDNGREDGRLFLAMSLIDGPTLQQALAFHRIRRQPIPPEVALRIIVQVCHALEYAHNACDHEGKPLHLVHRDIKPSNILLCPPEQVMLADFGVAVAKGNLAATDKTGTVIGTTRYMSPEQAWGKRVDHRSDLFSLGLVLYELLTLHPLYTEKEPASLFRAVQDADTGSSLELIQKDESLRFITGFLERTLQKDREARYASAGDMADVLDGFLKHLSHGTPVRKWLPGVIWPRVGSADHAASSERGNHAPQAELTGSAGLTLPDAEPVADSDSCLGSGRTISPSDLRIFGEMRYSMTMQGSRLDANAGTSSAVAYASSGVETHTGAAAESSDAGVEGKRTVPRVALKGLEVSPVSAEIAVPIHLLPVPSLPVDLAPVALPEPSGSEGIEVARARTLSRRRSGSLSVMVMLIGVAGIVYFWPGTPERESEITSSQTLERAVTPVTAATVAPPSVSTAALGLASIPPEPAAPLQSQVETHRPVEKAKPPEQPPSLPAQPPSIKVSLKSNPRDTPTAVVSVVDAPEVSEPAVTPLPATPAPKEPPAKTKLYVSSDPPAAIYLDDSPLNKDDNPVVGHDVSGDGKTHTLKVVWKNGQVIEENITLKKRQEIRCWAELATQKLECR